jgi:Protein of unknown function (DUF1214)
MNRRDLLRYAGFGVASGVAGVFPSSAFNLEKLPFDDVIAYLNEQNEVARRLGGRDKKLADSYLRQVMMVLSGSYTAVMTSSLQNPDFAPYIPYLTPYLGPNPDTNYGIAPVVSDGVYRIYGNLGKQSIAGLTLRDGGPHLGGLNGRRLGEIDFDHIDHDQNGNFSLVLSRAKPVEISAEQWFPLPENTSCIMSRRISKGPEEVDGNWEIERIDRNGRAGEESLNHKLDMVLSCARTTNDFVLSYYRKLQESGAEQGFTLMDQAEYGGLINQAYYFHVFNLAQDNMLILESDVPDSRYWSIQALDPFITSLDFVNHQTFLNDRQARPDPDGKVRLVLSSQDPGVHNWIDTQNWSEGVLLWRWNDVTELPRPVVKSIPVSEKLNGCGGQVSVDRRREILASRRRFYKARTLA